jgi:hypothetical protein
MMGQASLAAMVVNEVEKVFLSWPSMKKVRLLPFIEAPKWVHRFISMGIPLSIQLPTQAFPLAACHQRVPPRMAKMKLASLIRKLP